MDKEIRRLKDENARLRKLLEVERVRYEKDKVERTAYWLRATGATEETIIRFLESVK